MNIKDFINIKKATIAVTLFAALTVYAQGNLKMLVYDPGSSTGGATPTTANVLIDYAALDARFGTVTSNGIVKTTNTINEPNRGIQTLPNDVSGFPSDVQLIVIYGSYTSATQTTAQSITSAQGEALIAFVKRGGVLVSNMQSFRVNLPSGTTSLNKWIAERLLLQSGVNIVEGGPGSGGSPGTSYHTGIGPMGLYTMGSSAPTAAYSTSLWHTGVPVESRVYTYTAGQNTCNGFIMDFIAPSYPGDATAKAAGTNGFAYLTGAYTGALLVDRINTTSTPNPNLASLIYDFLYSPAAMATRRAWSTSSTNVNTNSNSCPPTTFAIECAAGSTAPAIQ